MRRILGPVPDLVPSEEQPRAEGTKNRFSRARVDLRSQSRFLKFGVMDASRVSIRPGVSVLSVLRHLNYKPWYAVAEFIDNSIQSGIANEARLKQLHGQSWRLKVAIDLDSASPGRIIVRDNAAGIDRATFPRAFRPAVVPPDRSGLSEFGMGMKSAACWFAPKWRVRTKALDETVERTVRFDITHIVRDELEELTIEERDAPKDQHFTELILDELHTIPVGRTLGKIKEHLADIYRVFIRQKRLELTLNGETLEYAPPSILMAPYFKDPAGEARLWHKPIEFDLGDGMRVTGFAALMDPGNYAKSGFALFRRDRLIEGSADDGYRPVTIFGRSGRNSFAALRLFGELNLEGFEVSHTKDGFRWDANEEPFLELLKEHLDSDDLPLLRQCNNYRSLGSRKDRAQAAEQALSRTSAAIIRSAESVLDEMSHLAPVETQETPLAPSNTLASREFSFSFRGEDWTIRMELSDDPGEGDWLSISDPPAGADRNRLLHIRVAMAHPFMISFAQTDADDIDPILRIAAAIALSERLARQAGVRQAGTVRRNINDLLREALSQP